MCPLAESSTTQDQPLLRSWAQLYRGVNIRKAPRVLEERGRWCSQLVDLLRGVRGHRLDKEVIFVAKMGKTLILHFQ